MSAVSLALVLTGLWVGGEAGLALALAGFFFAGASLGWRVGALRE